MTPVTSHISLIKASHKDTNVFRVMRTEKCNFIVWPREEILVTKYRSKTNQPEGWVIDFCLFLLTVCNPFHHINYGKSTLINVVMKLISNVSFIVLFQTKKSFLLVEIYFPEMFFPRKNCHWTILHWTCKILTIVINNLEAHYLSFNIHSITVLWISLFQIILYALFCLPVWKVRAPTLCRDVLGLTSPLQLQLLLLCCCQGSQNIDLGSS